MNAIRWKRGTPDKKVWGVGDLREYTVGAGYRVLNENDNSSSNKSFRELLSLKVAGSAQVCVWRAMLEKLPTRINLEKRGVVVISNLCPLCMKAEETAQHVLISCDIAQKCGTIVIGGRYLFC